MRALLLALCLVWATLHSGLRVAAPASRGGDRPVLASRPELAVLIANEPLRLRCLIARTPDPLPPAQADLPPGLSPPALGSVLALALSGLLERMLENQRAIQGTGTACSARGPPARERSKAHF